MADRMHDWIMSGERPLPSFVTPFAKSASGSSQDDDEDDDEEDDDEDDDEDADKSDDEIREELRKTRQALSKANGQSAKRRKALREREQELEEARKPKPKSKTKDDDDDGPDLDVIRHEAKTEGEKAGLARAKRAEAKSSLLAAGVNPDRVAKAVGLLDLDGLDLDDDGLDGVEDEIEDLRKSWPELFAKKRNRRQSIAGDQDGEREPKGRSTKTASEQAAARILGRS